MHDLVIRGGSVVDGSGAPQRRADVAVDGGIITAVGADLGRARRELDAAGAIVTPGWVDIHTHYDGQVTWDPWLSPSCWHGVTTCVMGNCGVGFAPAKPERREWLIGLMEGVEDIPGSALAEGIAWDWESFPQYLDSLQAQRRALDVATQVPHGAVRAYVMGERGASNEPATHDDIAAMAEIVRQGLQAGALGFSTSRTMLHRSKDGVPVPGTFANAAELLGIGRALRAAGHGVFEMASDMTLPEDEFAWISELSIQTGLPVSFALLQSPIHPDNWRGLLERTERANRAGARVTAQIACRPTGMILGWQSSVHPFIASPAYRAIARLPFAQRMQRLRDPGVRAAIVSEEPAGLSFTMSLVVNAFDRMFRLEHDGKLEYEPPPSASVAALAQRSGREPRAIVYDMLMERDGQGYVYLPLLNYAAFNFDHIHEMMLHDDTVLSLSDGGAHCGVICDASYPTYMLTHWARDRARGPRLSLERVVQMQTSRTARLYGLHDRGLLAPGMKADINVIDFDALRILPPQMAFDLPAQGRRLIQRAAGYRATLVSGEVTFMQGEATGELPGALIRGPRGVA